MPRIILINGSSQSQELYQHAATGWTVFFRERYRFTDTLIWNVAIGGRSLSTQHPVGNTALESRICDEYIPFLGNNDVAAGITAANMLITVLAIRQDAITRGCRRVWVVTIPPDATYNAAQNIERNAYNTTLRTTLPNVLDADLVLRDPDQQNQMNTRFLIASEWPDTVHPNTNGGRALSDEFFARVG